MNGFRAILGRGGGFLALVAITGVFFIAAGITVPVPDALRDAAPAEGFLPPGVSFPAFLVSIAALAYWAALRSSRRGWSRVLQVFVLVFGAQTFMTQIETAYFLGAFPLLHGSFELYRMVLRGGVWAFGAALGASFLTGAFRRSAPTPEAGFDIGADRFLRTASALGILYLALYMLFGYYVAWQSEPLRVFYEGSSEKLGFLAQWGGSLMRRPELPVFQWFRGGLWILCLVPLFKGFTGSRAELAVLSALALGLLPTVQLAFANPLMPASVSLAHFWEVSVSTGFFGAAAALVVPEPRTA